MQKEVYRKLAQRLDAIPNGFPATDGGVELRLLAKLFASQEAALAGVMRLTPEAASEIANRAGIDPDVALQMLEGMTARGLISSRNPSGRGRADSMSSAFRSSGGSYGPCGSK